MEKQIIAILLFLFVMRMVIVFTASRLIKPQELSEQDKEKFDEQEDDRLT
ncbi:hypothetical protein [Streptococcus cuniculipharyngis]|nr:hypothetical protein [Streptococcus cuniculipharyngis]